MSTSIKTNYSNAYVCFIVFHHAFGHNFHSEDAAEGAADQWVEDEARRASKIREYTCEIEDFWARE
jgi:hypothetical protein